MKYWTAGEILAFTLAVFAVVCPHAHGQSSKHDVAVAQWEAETVKENAEVQTDFETAISPAANNANK